MSKSINEIVYDASIGYLAVQAGKKDMPEFVQELDKNVGELRNYRKESYDPKAAYDEARRYLAGPHMQGTHVKVIRTLAIGHGIDGFSHTDHYTTLDVYLRNAFARTAEKRRKAQTRL